MMMMIGACLSFLWARKPARYDAIWGSWPGQFQLWRQQVTTAAATSTAATAAAAAMAQQQHQQKLSSAAQPKRLG